MRRSEGDPDSCHCQHRRVFGSQGEREQPAGAPLSPLVMPVNVVTNAACADDPACGPQKRYRLSVMTIRKRLSGTCGRPSPRSVSRISKWESSPRHRYWTVCAEARDVAMFPRDARVSTTQPSTDVRSRHEPPCSLSTVKISIIVTEVGQKFTPAVYETEMLRSPARPLRRRARRSAFTIRP